MKVILAIMVSLSLCTGAFAQRKIGGGYGGSYYHGYSSPRVVVVPSISYGFGFGYPYGGYPYYGYSPYGYPYGYRSTYGYRGTSSKLALQIDAIKLDYKKQIRDERHDKSISRADRRTNIRRLKNERDQAIVTAQENFNNRRMNNQNRGRYNNGNTNLNDGTSNQGNDSNSNSSLGTNL